MPAPRRGLIRDALALGALYSATFATFVVLALAVAAVGGP
jgi:hypothetical protein